MKKATVLYLLVGTTALTAATLICKQKAYDRGYEAGKNAGYKKGKESVFVVHDERDNIVDVPYEHIFKNQQLCFAYAASLT